MLDDEGLRDDIPIGVRAHRAAMLNIAQAYLENKIKFWLGIVSMRLAGWRCMVG